LDFKSSEISDYFIVLVWMKLSRYACSFRTMTALLEYLDLLRQHIGQTIDILTPGTNKTGGRGKDNGPLLNITKWLLNITKSI